MFAVNQPYRSPRRGIFGAGSGIMRRNSFLQIIGDAGIKTAVTAFDDINKPVHKSITQHMVFAIA